MALSLFDPYTHALTLTRTPPPIAHTLQVCVQRVHLSLMVIFAEVHLFEFCGKAVRYGVMKCCCSAHIIPDFYSPSFVLV